MALSLAQLQQAAYNMRRSSLLMTTHAGSGHLSSALSAADIMAALFLHEMQFDPENFENPNNDRFVLSKGHAAPILYAMYKELGLLSHEELLSYRQFDSALEGHPTLRFAYAQAATGSLGIGLSIGAGQALNAKMDGLDYFTYVLMGDSEMSEGSIWEAVQVAAYYKLNNLIGIIDCNRLGQSTPTMQALEGDQAEQFAAMVSSFGWQAIIVDGHDVSALIAAFDKAKKSDIPSMLIAQTKKGFGIDFIEDKQGYHGKALSTQDAKKALAALAKRFDQDAEAELDSFSKLLSKEPVAVPDKKVDQNSRKEIAFDLPADRYPKNEKVATRKVYGQALIELGGQLKEIVSLDGEVKNSTYAELFEQVYPDRFVQCFIAEQNMVSMAVGLQRCGKVPFVSSFGAFLSRAHDQIRMAAIGQSALRICGSHAGVSIGADGPSQMALEDISMMAGLPESIVLYPSDAVSCFKLVQQMANYHKGVSYLRTTRMATPVLYDAQESFEIGGCKVVKQSDNDQLCIIGAGITLHEAIKAYGQLAKENIAVSVIDLYCIKPLDATKLAQLIEQSHKKVIIVEDHYAEGGIGQIVAAALSNYDFKIEQLAVTQLARSGKPEELLTAMGIDARAIYQTAKIMVT